MHIEHTTYCYEHIKFVKQFTFYKWESKTYAEVGEYIPSLEQSNSARQLKQLVFLDPVDKNGNDVCYNNWLVVKRGNELITLCLGDVFYWVKVKPKLKNAT